jgi:glycerol-3-phosphate acyltransferase PlsY
VVWIFWPEPALIGMQLVVTGMLFWRHRANIRNLIQGTEGKIGTRGP